MAELLERLRQTKLWLYEPPENTSTPDSVIPVIDNDMRVGRGEFVLGVRPGYFDALVCTGPGAFRDLRKMKLPSDLSTKSGRLIQASPEEAAELWQYLLANDHGLATFVARMLDGQLPDLLTLLDDPSRRIKDWHKVAIRRAISIANRNLQPFSPILLLAGFLAEAQRRQPITTLAYVLRVLTLERQMPAEHVAAVLDLGFVDLGGDDPILVVSEPATGIIDRFLEAANAAREAAERMEPPAAKQIHTRHIAAAFLRDDEVTEHLENIGVDMHRLRADTFRFILDSVPGADADRWRQVLGVEASVSSPVSVHASIPLPPPPQFSIPTRVARDTWTLDDKLGYALYARAITESIINGETEPPLTIGIQAPWGQGKTSLMRMMQNELDPGAPQRDESATVLPDVRTSISTTYKQLLEWGKQKAPMNGMIAAAGQQVPTVWFNPLYYRETSQIWAGMAHAILHQLVGRLEPADRELFWFRLQQSRINMEAIRRDVHHWLILRFVPIGIALLAALAVSLTVLAVSPAIVPLLSGGVLTTGIAAFVVNWLREKRKPIDQPFERYVTEPNYRSELGLLHLIDHDLDRALRLLVSDRPIAVFVDDLDRCDPATVNQVILAINQFLSLPRRNVFFFLGMDMEMVAAALERAQKEMLGDDAPVGSYRRSFGWRFMEKFVQLPFVIPHLDNAGARKFAEAHLGGIRPPEVGAEKKESVVRQIDEAPTAAAVGELMANVPPLPPEEALEVQKVASSRVAELMKSSDSEEMQRIAEIAVQDLELNPRTIVRYFCLVRVLRNIQLATGRAQNADEDRKLVLRAAHLLMNWPQFVQWLRNEPELLTEKDEWKPAIEEIDALAMRATTVTEWREGVTGLLRRKQQPPYLLDASLYRYLRKLATEPPSLSAMYTAHLF